MGWTSGRLLRLQFVGALLLPLLAGPAPAAVVWGVDDFGPWNPPQTVGNRIVRFDSSDPLGTIVSVGGTGLQNEYVNALDFGGNGTLYAANFGSARGGIDYIPPKLYTISQANGAATLVGAMNLPYGEYVNDLSWNPVTGVMLALTNNGNVNNLFSVNLGTGNATLVGQITGIGSPSGLVSLASDSAGNNYVQAYWTDRMYRLGGASGTAAVAMSAVLPFNTDTGSQGMAIDWSAGSNGEWLWSGYGTAPNTNGIYRIDPVTGGVSATLALWGNDSSTGYPRYALNDIAIAIPEPAALTAAVAPSLLHLLRRRRNVARARARVAQTRARLMDGRSMSRKCRSRHRHRTGARIIR